MFTPITIQYLGDPEREGGRRHIIEEETVDCVWSPISKTKGFNPRLIELGIDVEVQTILEDSLLNVYDYEVEVVYNGQPYRVVEIEAVPEDLGLDGTYTMYLKRIKKR
jgi:hypothetical protein